MSRIFSADVSGGMAIVEVTSTVVATPASGFQISRLRSTRQRADVSARFQVTSLPRQRSPVRMQPARFKVFWGRGRGDEDDLIDLIG